MRTLPYSPSYLLRDIRQHHGSRRAISKLKAFGLCPFQVGSKWECEHENYVSSLKALAQSRLGAAVSQIVESTPKPPKARRKRLSVADMTPEDLAKRERMNTSMVAKYVGCSIQTVTRAMERGILIPIGGLKDRPEFKRTQVDEVRHQLPLDGKKRRNV